MMLMLLTGTGIPPTGCRAAASVLVSIAIRGATIMGLLSGLLSGLACLLHWLV